MDNLRRHAKWLRIVGCLLWVPVVVGIGNVLGRVQLLSGWALVAVAAFASLVTWAFCLAADVLDSLHVSIKDASATEANTRVVADGVKRNLAATYDVVPTPEQSKADRFRR
jgi:hypothetical protein